MKRKSVIGIDLYNQTITGGASKTLNAIRSDSDHRSSEQRERRVLSNADSVACSVAEDGKGNVTLMPIAHSLTAGGGKPGQCYPCVLIVSDEEDIRREEIFQMARGRGKRIAP